MSRMSSTYLSSTGTPKDSPQSIQAAQIYRHYQTHPLPADITKTAPRGKVWVFERNPDGTFRLILKDDSLLLADRHLVAMHDVEIERHEVQVNSRLGVSELETIVRKNKLVEHLRQARLSYVHGPISTSIDKIGTVRVGALYRSGETEDPSTLVPLHIQTKSGALENERVEHIMRYAYARHPYSNCRPVVVQQFEQNKVALFELALEKGRLQIINEMHVDLLI